MKKKFGYCPPYSSLERAFNPDGTEDCKVYLNCHSNTIDTPFTLEELIEFRTVIDKAIEEFKKLKGGAQ